MKQEELKDKLLSGEILFKEFYDSIIALDQSTRNRMEAFKNLEVLTDSSIAEFVQGQSQEIQKDYCYAVSFTEFHIGQIKAYEERKQGEALVYFKKSLDHYLKLGDAPESIAYRKATIAYLENDIESLKGFAKEDNRGNNPAILKNMINGLEQRGYPAYWEDYRV